MNLGGSLHTYAHLCVGLGLWMTLGSASIKLTWFSSICALLLVGNYLRDWRKEPLKFFPIWLVLLESIVWLWWSNFALESLLGVLSLLTLSRLLTARRSYEYTQLLLLTFGQVLFASTLEFDLSFGIALVIYMILVTTTLTLNHLYSEIEQSTLLVDKTKNLEKKKRKLRRRLESTRLIDGYFLAGLGAIAAFLCLTAILLFFLFPRVGGQWYQGYQLGPSRSGFSGEIALGGVGEIQLDDRVAFRALVRQLSPDEPIEIAGQLPEIEPTRETEPKTRETSPAIDQQMTLGKKGMSLLNQRMLRPDQRYWIGRVHDHYEDGQWRQSRLKTKRLPQSPTRWINQSGLRYSQRTLILQHFYIDARGHDTLFHLGQALAVSLPMTSSNLPLHITEEGGLVYDWPGDLHYAVLSFGDMIGSTNISEQEYYSNDKNDDYQKRFSKQQTVLKPYLQLPKELNQKLKTYALKLVGQETNPIKIALLLEKHLQETFKYRLHQPDDLYHYSMDPVLYFLYESKAGHCEYFSTALTLLLRSLNIPARNVTGYAGGEWSELGSYYTVYQKNAHAWVEMWIGNSSLPLEDHQAWLRLDPTPLNTDTEKSKSFWIGLKKWKDHVQFLWFRYVLGFDTRDQIKVVSQTKQTVNHSLERIKYLQVWSIIKSHWKTWLLYMIFILGFSSLLHQQFRKQLLRWVSEWTKQVWARIYLFYHNKKIEETLRVRNSKDEEFIQQWRVYASFEVSRLYEKALYLCEQLPITVQESSTGEDIILLLKEFEADYCQNSTSRSKMNQQQLRYKREESQLSQSFEKFYQVYTQLRFSQAWTSKDLEQLRKHLEVFKGNIKTL